jgi:hypothetical protein
MAMWNPWRGCHKYSEGCRFCYIHKGDAKRGVDTNVVTKADNFCAPVERYKRGDKKGEYKMKSPEKRSISAFRPISCCQTPTSGAATAGA